MATAVTVQPTVVTVGEPVNTTLAVVLGVVTFICCNFCCLGLASLIYALQANSAQNAGNSAKAREKAATAKKLAIVASIGTIIVIVISVILEIVGIFKQGKI